MDKKELYIKVAKEILTKLDEISDICNENGIDRANWMKASSDGNISFELGEYEFMRKGRDGKLCVTYQEEV